MIQTHPSNLSRFDPRYNATLRSTLPRQRGRCLAWTIALTSSTWEQSPRCRAVMLSAISGEDIDARFSPGWVDLLGELPKGTLHNLSHASVLRHASFRYVLQISGVNFDSRRPYWLAFTRAVLFLQDGPYRTLWFRAALQPYVHYVPVKEDLSDLIKQLMWARSHMAD